MKNDEKGNMRRLLNLIMIFVLIVSPVFAADEGVRFFTNDDIEKYKRPSDRHHDEDQKSVNESDRISDYGNNSENKLNRHIVPYKGSARRIIIPVTFNGRVTAPMLLDTGAPGMHISYKLAEQLNIIDSRDNELRVIIGGIGGTTPAILMIIDSIEVRGAKVEFIPTLISESISPNFEGLIGMGFMTKYNVRIDTKKRVVIFEELPKDSDMPGGHDKEWWRGTFSRFKSIMSAWDDYRKRLARRSIYTDQQREINLFVNRQYEKAEELYNKLSVYASEHSVPLEWR